MSRVTAPVSKLSRTISSAPVSRSVNTLRDTSSHNAGAVLMPKYAELLRNRSSEHADSSRGLTTTHRPTPQPSLANRAKPLMQTFHSSTATSAAPASHLDATVLPSMSQLSAAAMPDLDIRVPLLPDNYGVVYASEAFPAPATAAEIEGISIVAVEPDRVMPATPFSEVHGLDVELKFAHVPTPAAAEVSEEGGMLKDIWKGMVDDVFGGPLPKAA